MTEHPCRVCGRRAAEEPPAPPPCALEDPEAEPARTGREWSPLFGWTPMRRRPRRACPAGLPRRSQAAFLAGRNERRDELRTERRKRP